MLIYVLSAAGQSCVLQRSKTGGAGDTILQNICRASLRVPLYMHLIIRFLIPPPHVAVHCVNNVRSSCKYIMTAYSSNNPSEGSPWLQQLWCFLSACYTLFGAITNLECVRSRKLTLLICKDNCFDIGSS